MVKHSTPREQNVFYLNFCGFFIWNSTQLLKCKECVCLLYEREVISQRSSLLVRNRTLKSPSFWIWESKLVLVFPYSYTYVFLAVHVCRTWSLCLWCEGGHVTCGWFPVLVANCIQGVQGMVQNIHFLVPIRQLALKLWAMYWQHQFFCRNSKCK